MPGIHFGSFGEDVICGFVCFCFVLHEEKGSCHIVAQDGPELLDFKKKSFLGVSNVWPVGVATCLASFFYCFSSCYSA